MEKIRSPASVENALRGISKPESLKEGLRLKIA
jgi:hypothetical protein